jgi:hypothetical protein
MSKVTTARLIRWAGLFAILAGTLYIVIQFVHPLEQVASVNTASWVVVACLTVVMSLCSLIGITGLYARQVRETGLLGLAGLLLGIATFRAGVLPRLGAALLAFGAAVTLAGGIIPHPLDRILAVPMGLAFIWLGYALWSTSLSRK